MNDTYDIQKGQILVNGTPVTFSRFLTDFAGGDERQAIGFLATHLGISMSSVRQQLKKIRLPSNNIKKT